MQRSSCPCCHRHQTPLTPPAGFRPCSAEFRPHQSQIVDGKLPGRRVGCLGRSRLGWRSSSALPLEVLPAGTGCHCLIIAIDLILVESAGYSDGWPRGHSILEGFGTRVLLCFLPVVLQLSRASCHIMQLNKLRMSRHLEALVVFLLKDVAGQYKAAFCLPVPELPCRSEQHPSTPSIDYNQIPF